MKQGRCRLLTLAAGMTAAALLGGCAGAPAGRSAAVYVPGEYDGYGNAFRGPVQVLVETGPHGILRVELVDHADDELIGGAAMEDLAALVLEWNSAELDAVSGATESSEGFLEALEDALSRARVP
ncbi:MAG: FMN-binding protein [Treponema sp.]|jgi:fumarate reductase flavoprotein subunit|nr:FMN-binding protein [Treponema sp.]